MTKPPLGELSYRGFFISLIVLPATYVILKKIKKIILSRKVGEGLAILVDVIFFPGIATVSTLHGKS